MSKKYDRKHLALSQRIGIEEGFDSNESFTSIAARIGKDPSTISKEVRRHLTHYTKCENGSKVFLTMLFRNCSLMLLFPLEEKIQACVAEVFDLMTRQPGIDAFRKLFQVIPKGRSLDCYTREDAIVLINHYLQNIF